MFSTRIFRKNFVRLFSTTIITDIAVVGAGAGGTAVSAQLKKQLNNKKISLIDGSEHNYYQPGFTCLGGHLWGEAERFEDGSGLPLLRRKTSETVPKGVEYLPNHVKSFIPEENKMMLENGDEVIYENLVVSIGVTLNYDAVKGMREAIFDPQHPVCTIYELDRAIKTNKMLRQFKGGNALFTQPPTAVKCGGAPQKIMYLANDYWQKNGIKANVNFNLPQAVIFGAPKYAKALAKFAEEHKFEVSYQHELIEIDKGNQEAVFKTNEGEVRKSYDFLHCIPKHETSQILAPLADSTGFMDVDKETLQHTKYPNVFGIGDCTNIPTSKTAAAAFSQAPVVAHNLVQLYNGMQLKKAYKGYSACPIYLGKNQLMLAEFKFAGEPDQTFTSSQDSGYFLFFLFARDFFNRIYFHLVPRGVWYGRDMIFKPKY